MPAYLAAARERLGELSRLHTTTAVGQLSGTIGLIRELVPALAAEAGRDAPDTDSAIAALEEHRDWLAARADAAEREPRLGADLFAAKLDADPGHGLRTASTRSSRPRPIWTG